MQLSTGLSELRKSLTTYWTSNQTNRSDKDQAPNQPKVRTKSEDLLAETPSINLKSIEAIAIQLSEAIVKIFPEAELTKLRKPLAPYPGFTHVEIAQMRQSWEATNRPWLAQDDQALIVDIPGLAKYQIMKSSNTCETIHGTGILSSYFVLKRIDESNSAPPEIYLNIDKDQSPIFISLRYEGLGHFIAYDLKAKRLVCKIPGLGESKVLDIAPRKATVHRDFINDETLQRPAIVTELHQEQ